VSEMYEFIDAEKDAVTEAGEKKYSVVSSSRPAPEDDFSHSRDPQH
jgi:hypothetical protein